MNIDDEETNEEILTHAVSSERSVNDMLRCTLQQIFREHQIVVTEVAVEWSDLSSNDGPDFVVKSLSATITAH